MFKSKVFALPHQMTMSSDFFVTNLDSSPRLWRPRANQFGYRYLRVQETPITTQQRGYQRLNSNIFKLQWDRVLGTSPGHKEAAAPECRWEQGSTRRFCSSTLFPLPAAEPCPLAHQKNREAPPTPCQTSTQRRRERGGGGGGGRGGNLRDTVTLWFDDFPRCFLSFECVCVCVWGGGGGGGG